MGLYLFYIYQNIILLKIRYFIKYIIFFRDVIIILKNIEIKILLKYSVIFKINNEINKKVERTFLSSSISFKFDIINKILIEISYYFLVYFVSNNI